MLLCVVMSAAGFLSGSVLYSYFLPKWFRRVDVRVLPGDGNPGAHNAIRAVGAPLGGLCLFLDILKGFAPVFIAAVLLHIRGGFLAPVAAAPVLGHAFSPWVRFRGGKGVAVTFGVLMGLFPVSWILLSLVAALLLLRFVFVVRPDSDCVTAAMVLAFLLCLLFEPRFSMRLALFCVGLVVIFQEVRHPDAGEHYVRVWHYRLEREGYRFRLVHTP